MRCFKLLLMGGIVLALTSPGWALSLMNYTIGDPIAMHFNSVDVGPLYNYGTQTGYTNVDALQLAPAAGLGSPAYIPGEDAWGIAYLSNITDPGGGVTYWSQATSPTEVTALFAGTHDFSIDFVQGATTYVVGGKTYRDDTFKSFSNNFKFMLFEDTAKDYTISGGPEARIGAYACLLYTSPSPRDRTRSRMPSSA